MYLESDSLRVSYSIELGFRVQGKSDSVQFYRKGPPCQLVASEWHRSALNCTKNAGQIIVPHGNLSAAFSLLLVIAHSSLIEIRYFRRLKFPKKSD